jgi:hypothetical protein
MYIDFDPDSLNYDLYFMALAKQTGHGDLAGFQGTRFQRGAGQSGQGLGNIFRSLWHLLMPIAKTIGRNVGREALVAGTQIASDVLDGQEPIESVKKRGHAAASRLLDQAQTGLQQTGMGRKRKRTGQKSKTAAKKRKVTKRKAAKKRVSKKQRHGSKRFGSDALGLLG